MLIRNVPKVKSQCCAEVSFDSSPRIPPIISAVRRTATTRVFPRWISICMQVAHIQSRRDDIFLLTPSDYGPHAQSKCERKSNNLQAVPARSSFFAQTVPRFDELLIRNFNHRSPVPFPEVQEASIPMNDAEKFREYAAECLRLAQKAAAQDKAVLLEIANAWIACADEAECKANGLTKKT